MNKSFSSASRPARGFSLVEALVAFLVIAFGMIALGSLQVNLAQASENAKHRGEATRLAQQRMEVLRTYYDRVANGAVIDYTDIVSNTAGEQIANSGADIYLNTTFTRRWWVTKEDGATVADASDPQKWLRVQVSWVDRLNQTQSVTLQSVVALSSPIDVGVLAVGPGKSKPRSPKNRNIDIPYPAVSLTGSKSAFKPDGSTSTFVFDNISGDIVGKCDSTVTLGEGGTFDATATGCQSLNAYLLSGYVHFIGNLPSSGNERNFDNGITNPNNATKAFATTGGVTLAFPDFATGLNSSSYECFHRRRKIISANNPDEYTITSITHASNVVTVTTSATHSFVVGMKIALQGVPTSLLGAYTIASVPATNQFTLAKAGSSASSTGGLAIAPATQTVDEATSYSGYGSTLARFVIYTCVIQPWDHDNDVATPGLWWGKLLFTTDGTWAITNSGTASVRHKVCRFSGDYVQDNTLSNAEHPLWYRGVSGAVDNQNYLVIQGSENCPTNSKSNPLSDDYINVNTVLHQDNGLAGGAYSSSTTQWATLRETADPTGTSDRLTMLEP
jgi:Tfp pilus assembly protein PilV